MKKCTKCGVVQKDSNNICIECGAPLPRPMSDEEEYRHNLENSYAIEDMVERNAAFYVSPIQRVIGIIALVLALAGIICLVIYGFSEVKSPDIGYILYSIPFSLGTGILLLFPRFAWNLSHFGIRWQYDVDLSPSDLYMMSQRIMCYILLAAGALMFAYGAYRMF